MQSGGACPGDTPEYFGGIPFERVYHEGGIAGDNSIIQHRCAEILVRSPLPLTECLQWVYCRSSAERETLLHFLGRSASRWENLIRVSEDLKLFQREFVFVEELLFSNDGVSFRLNPRLDRQNVAITITVRGAKGGLMHQFKHYDMPALPNLPAKRWITKCELPNGRYHVQVTLEGHLAFEGEIRLGPTLV
jgi:hypothetical protein